MRASPQSGVGSDLPPFDTRRQADACWARHLRRTDDQPLWCTSSRPKPWSRLLGRPAAGDRFPKANALSLITQMPTREASLTSRLSRKLQRGNRTIELMHSSRWQLVLGAHPASMAISSLSRMEPEQVFSALKILHAKLPPAEWAAMRSSQTVLPAGWSVR